MGRATKPGKPGAWSGLNDFLTGVPELSVPDEVALSEPAPVHFSSSAAAIARAAAAHVAADQPTWFANSVTETERRARPSGPPLRRG